MELSVIDLVIKILQDAVFNHLLPMVQELSPFECRIFFFELPISVKVLAGVFCVGVVNTFLTDDDTRSFCGQCRSRSDCTKPAV